MLNASAPTRLWTVSEFTSLNNSQYQRFNSKADGDIEKCFHEVKNNNIYNENIGPLPNPDC